MPPSDRSRLEHRSRDEGSRVVAARSTSRGSRALWIGLSPLRRPVHSTRLARPTPSSGRLVTASLARRTILHRRARPRARDRVRWRARPTRADGRPPPAHPAGLRHSRHDTGRGGRATGRGATAGGPAARVPPLSERQLDRADARPRAGRGRRGRPRHRPPGARDPGPRGEGRRAEPGRAGPLVAGPDPARPLALRAGDAEPEAAGPQARLAAGLAVGARGRSPRRAARRPRRRLPGRRPREPAPGPRAARPRRADRDRPRRDRPRDPGGRPRLGRAGVRLLPRRRRARLAARGDGDAPPRRAPLPHPFDAPARARPDRGRPRGAAPGVPGAGADPQPGSLPTTGGGRRAGRLGQVDAGGREGAAARARGLPDPARLLQPAPCYHATTRAC